MDEPTSATMEATTYMPPQWDNEAELVGSTPTIKEAAASQPKNIIKSSNKKFWWKETSCIWKG